MEDPKEAIGEIEMLDDRDDSEKQKSEEETDLYNISNFSI
jgi:hypothetical protein